MRAPTNWKAYGIFVAGLLLFCAAVSGASSLLSDRATWRAKYQRPAQIPFPENNPYSAAKADLGRMLFFDPILSGSRTLSCSSCHNPGLSWADGRPRAVGEGHVALPLRAPTLIDIAWVPILGWDGKFKDLENVTFGPITAPANMNLSKADLIKRLNADPGYVRAFANSFGNSGITPRNIELALATFERTIAAGEAPFDRWINGDETAIDEAAKRGFDIFNSKGHCASCHSGPTFTDGSFHDIGTAHGDDIGRGRFFPTSPKLRYAFKTPTLRDVARRAPYMHDGSVPTLEAVIDLYDRGGIARPSRSEFIGPLNLSNNEKADLIAFLRTLTAPPQPVTVPDLTR